MTREESTQAKDDRDVRRGKLSLASIATAAVASFLPPIIAFAIDWYLWTDVPTYTLFYPAIFLSAWRGDYRTGVVSTLLSAALVWYFIVPPSGMFAKPDPRYAVTATVFIANGVLVSFLFERIRRANRAAGTALAAAARTNDELRRAVAERQVFAALIENSSDFIAIASPTGTPTYINPAGRRMVGFPPDVPLESTALPDYYPPELRGFARDVILSAVNEHGGWEGETRFKHWQTGQSIPVWDTHFLIREPETQRILGIGSVTRDMSAPGRARAELEATNQRLETTMTKLEEAQRVAHLGSWSLDLERDVLEWSDELFRIFGREPGEPVPRLRNHTKVYTPESATALEGALAKMKRDGEPFELDLELIRPDGSTRWISSRATAKRNDAGKVVRITGTAQDITELRRLQILREEWVSVIAHDLRQPIGIIHMAADLLPELHRGDLNDAESGIIHRIGSAARHLSRMVDDMLDASRIEAHRLSLERTWVDPASLVHDAVGNASHMAADVEMRVSTDHDLPQVFVDPERIEQILSNLISNAIKYGEKESGIDIRVSGGPGQVEIVVANRGHGIPPEEIPTLFNRFERSKSTRRSNVEGLGLGLYIARGLVNAHGGRIWCISVPNETTEFHFTLPTHAALVFEAA
jgi:PAS domain S-box